jgi:hypothetical protein
MLADPMRALAIARSLPAAAAGQWFRRRAITGAPVITWTLCFGLANLCSIRFWWELYAIPAAAEIAPATAADHLAAIFSSLTLSAILFVVFSIGGKGLRVFTAAAACLLILKESLLVFGPAAGSGAVFVSIMFGSTFLNSPNPIESSLRRLTTKTVKLISNSMLPLASLVLLHSIWLMIPSAAPAAAAVGGSLPGQARKSHRVVWILFDGLDQKVAFTNRPPGLRLFHFDRFRSQAEYEPAAASNPAGDRATSIASLLAGYQQTTLRNTIVERLGQQGFRTAVVGWSLPYCSQLQSTACAAWPEAGQSNSYDPHPTWNRLRSLFETPRYSPFGQSLGVARAIEQVEEMTRAATIAAARPDLDFVFLHLPHATAPYVWNPLTGQPTARIRPWDTQGYLRNLEWADSAFGRIRRAMEESGVWDQSTVLLSSNQRSADASRFAPVDATDPNDAQRALFVLKSPDWVDLDPSEPFQTIRTAALLEPLLRARSSSPPNLH